MRSMSDINEAFRIALNAIRGYKSRGILTTLGIIIGIVAVVTTMTAANGLSNNFKESISAVGSDVFHVSRTPWIFSGNFRDFRNRPNLTYKDSQKLETRLNDALAINPTTDTRRDTKYESEVLEGTRIVGTTDKHIAVSEGLPEFGRFLVPADIQYKKKVCVIGTDIKDRLFKNVDPINKKIKIGWYKFRIVGIMEKQGSAGFFGGPNFDSQIFVPITTFEKYFGGRHRGYTISVKAPSQEAMADFEYELMGEMRKIRKLKPVEQDNFAINTMDTLIDAYNNVMGIVVLVGLLITGISLFVGGIGVMNIMFVSVTERTREIGIRKSIGAKKKSILAQFLFESSTICMIGGIIGVVLSFGVASLINTYVMPASISLPIVIVALIISILTGVISGFIPAYRASRLNPITALSFE
ncbi:MAG: FtsX-like permease family protein [Calditrichaeota bacterium]|nr:MAG: peptide ABC transporter permease [Calditrichota bacterium]MBL1206541.1 FtsX-like permease family protein [Calditrichota bacterium]NOG46368.1 FtsX-like permease family protein [Calditrichota bacterium]